MGIAARKIWLAVAATAIVCTFTMGLVACSSPTQSEDKATTADEAPTKEAATPDTKADAETEKPAAKPKSSQDKAKETGNPALAEKLNADIAAVAESAGMDVGVAVIDLTDGTKAGYHADQSVVSASMIKLIVAHTFLKEVKAGTYALDDLYTLKASDLVGGAGVIAGYGAGAQISYRDILMRMIDCSDNTAANILIDAVGMDAINADATKIGLSGTKINRRMMDTEAIAAGVENYVSADDIARLLQMVHKGTFVGPKSSALMLKALEQQEDWGGIRNGLPEGMVFAHKTGNLSNAHHDGGIAEGDHPVIIVVLCSGSGFWEGGANQAMAQVASVVTTDCNL